MIRPNVPSNRELRDTSICFLLQLRTRGAGRDVLDQPCDLHESNWLRQASILRRPFGAFHDRFSHNVAANSVRLNPGKRCTVVSMRSISSWVNARSPIQKCTSKEKTTPFNLMYYVQTPRFQSGWFRARNSRMRALNPFSLFPTSCRHAGLGRVCSSGSCIPETCASMVGLRRSSPDLP